ncbi:MAG: pentapeptide repeat-containing protein [Candidatus Midichloriaceae bacterium]|jgi:uncharacterized protein YjbI with pentapeptide repeats|nr:pentapeptide repeat-containing protein [Candidatus Midichloriaceae bacterium]
MNIIRALSVILVFALPCVAYCADEEKLSHFLKKEQVSKPLNLEAVDMRGYDLVEPAGKGKEFYGANMKNSIFKGKTLRAIKFEKVNFEGANFEDANLSKVSFIECNLKNANFKDAILKFGGIRNSNLTNTNFESTNFESIGFTDSELINTNFTKATLFRVSFINTKLESVVWKDSEIKDCSGL